MIRRGLSRVELLVILIVVVLVVGLVLAAIGRVRESANLTRCRSNLRQLGLAVHNYTDVNGRLPPLTDQGENAPTGRGLPSVFGTLIPYIESTSLSFRRERPPDAYHGHSSIGFPYPNKDGTIDTEYGGVANQVSRVFLDAADTTADRLRDVPMTLPDGSTGHYATGNYAANGLLPWAVRGLGSFPGPLSNTVLIGERPQVCRTATGEAVYNLWGLGFYSPHMPAFAALTPADPPGLWSTEQIAAVEPLPEESASDRDARIRVRIGRRDAAPEAPDFTMPIQIIRDGRPCDPRLPGTPHRAGMQVAMADGSVRAFGRDTSSWVFWAACMPPDKGNGQ